jgi:hypothetical protein
MRFSAACTSLAALALHLTFTAIYCVLRVRFLVMPATRNSLQAFETLHRFNYDERDAHAGGCESLRWGSVAVLVTRHSEHDRTLSTLYTRGEK